MFWMVFWMRPPTMLRVLMPAPVFTRPPLPPCEIVAKLASISRFWLLWLLFRLMVPVAVKTPSVWPLSWPGIRVSAGVPLQQAGLVPETIWLWVRATGSVL